VGVAPHREAVGMIISRTPFRISLAGGGSDLAEYYRARAGNVVTLAINRYMYVTVNRRFDDHIRVSYTRTEIVEHLDDLQHDLIREALRMVGLTQGIEVTTIADLPAGIGLGSSSSLTVGVLNALYALKGEWMPAAELARRACDIEIAILKKPIGKQDQYIAAFGGFHDIGFLPDERVSVHPVVCAPTVRHRLLRQLMLFYTGVRREAGSVLTEARERLAMQPEARVTIDGLVALAAQLREGLISGRVDHIGQLLDESWSLKKKMASTVSNGHLDELYLLARQAGATGGKIAGAGGGGCLLLYVKRPKQKGVRDVMTHAGLREIAFDLEPEGSRIIHYTH
jgi:D-glycero-alpha-D-manno-heptose-7-phosphate kinase